MSEYDLVETQDLQNLLDDSDNMLITTQELALLHNSPPDETIDIDLEHLENVLDDTSVNIPSSVLNSDSKFASTSSN